MEKFDVIIVGSGPAGLKCAEELSTGNKTVLLLDKNKVLGDKLCAGGLTMKDLEILPLSDEVIEHKISTAAILSKRRRADTLAPYPFLFTLNRKDLAAYQLSLLDNSSIEIRLGNQVSGIEGDRVIMKDSIEYKFQYLVGADGYSSIVRRYLNLPVTKKLIGFQYEIPKRDVEPVLEIYLDSGRFKYWYAWIFPHKESIAVGCCCDPELVNHKRIMENLDDWLLKMKIDKGDARVESYPISYDYRGFQFGNIFLAGEAGGLASGLTGEGIYQSLASGREIARMIMDPGYISETMQEVLAYNRMLQKVMNIFRWSGPARGILHELLVFLMNRKQIGEKINSTFSKKSPSTN